MPADNLRGVTAKPTRDVLKRARKAGAEIHLTPGGHVKIVGPNGIVFTGVTGHSRGNIHKKLESQIRAAGIEI